MIEINIFGIKIHPLSRADFISIIKSNLKQGFQTTQFGVNSATVNELKENEEFKRAMNNADLVNIDGMSVVWGLRWLGFAIPERVATPDLAEDVMNLAEKEGYRVFLLGAREPVISLCLQNLRKTYPELIIAGYHNGYYKQEEEFRIVDMINESRADILLIGMSSPKKELFSINYRSKLNVKYILGVGGYFDIISGRIKRAPRWMQNIGMEWTYRLLQEPERMWRRYLIGTNQFFGLVAREKRIRKRR